MEEERRGRRSTSKKREGAGGMDPHTTTARERDKLAMLLSGVGSEEVKEGEVSGEK